VLQVVADEAGRNGAGIAIRPMRRTCCFAAQLIASCSADNEKILAISIDDLVARFASRLTEVNAKNAQLH
jgi:hypothetical protein